MTGSTGWSAEQPDLILCKAPGKTPDCSGHSSTFDSERGWTSSQSLGHWKILVNLKKKGKENSDQSNSGMSASIRQKGMSFSFGFLFSLKVELLIHLFGKFIEFNQFYF